MCYLIGREKLRPSP